MPTPRDAAFFIDILHAARAARNYLGNKTFDSFLSDPQCQDAVVRRLEIIGEAAKRISKETRANHPGLPWAEMTGLRDVLIHDYDDIDLNIVWDTVLKDLPPLIQELEKFVS